MCHLCLRLAIESTYQRTWRADEARLEDKM
jgi:hypothetical protein